MCLCGWLSAPTDSACTLVRCSKGCEWREKEDHVTTMHSGTIHYGNQISRGRRKRRGNSERGECRSRPQPTDGRRCPNAHKYCPATDGTSSCQKKSAAAAQAPVSGKHGDIFLKSAMLRLLCPGKWPL